MRTFNEREALAAAVATSAIMLVGTFVLAWAIRVAFFPARLQNIAENPAAMPVAEKLSADAEQGRHLFLLNCAHCHGDDARGDEGPDLYDLRKSDERIRRQILDGVKGEMPSFVRKLNDSDVRALTAYLRTLHS